MGAGWENRTECSYRHSYGCSWHFEIGSHSTMAGWSWQVAYPQGKMKKQTITEEELQAAINKFLNSGGMIVKLPDQKTGQGKMVGKKWDNSEMGGGISS